MTEQSAEIKDLATALLSFQASTHGVVKDSKNPAFKSKYASLEAVIETSRDGLQKAGIAFTQMPGAMVDNRLSVTTMLIHVETGQWLRTTMQIPLAKVDAQGAGSATTYACRYSLMAMLGLPPVDDDAMEASRPAPRPQPKAVAKPRPTGTPEQIRDFIEEALTNATSRQGLLAVSTEYEAEFLALPEAMQADLTKVYQVKEKALEVFGEAA